MSPRKKKVQGACLSPTPTPPAGDVRSLESGVRTESPTASPSPDTSPPDAFTREDWKLAVKIAGRFTRAQLTDSALAWTAIAQKIDFVLSHQYAEFSPLDVAAVRSMHGALQRRVQAGEPGATDWSKAVSRLGRLVILARRNRLATS